MHRYLIPTEFDGYKVYDKLIGKTFTEIEVTKGAPIRDHILFKTDTGIIFIMEHEQSCCEDVNIEDIIGNVSSLLNSPILVAEERFGDLPKKDDCDESYTWTFYEFATLHGSVTIRWYGSSNGYYSEKVDFYELIEDDK